MKAQRGFTTLEILITLTIAAVLLVLISPDLWKFRQHARIQGESFHIRSEMRIAREQAVATNTIRMMQFDAGRNEIVYSRVGFLGGVLDTTEIYRRTIEEPVHLGRATFGGHPVVKFFADGTLSSSGTVDLSDRRESYRLSALMATGRVTVASL